MSQRPRPTMRQVAEEAGVSTMTVSYAYSQPDRLSPAAAAKVHAAAQKLGYPGPHPGARSLRRGRAGSLGIVWGERLTYAFDDPQAARFLAGVAEICADEGVGLTMLPLTGTDRDLRWVADAVVDAFVVWTTSDDDPVLDAVAATGLPAAVHAGPGRPGLPVVGIDDHAAAAAIGREAWTGATRPTVLSFPINPERQTMLVAGGVPAGVTYPVTRHRWEGLHDAWLQLGGSSAELQVAVIPNNAAAQGQAVTERLLASNDPPDAIAAMSDELAIGALRAAARAGVEVPEALAVTGWDDTDAAAPQGLTTLAQSLRDQGRRCARLALGQAAEDEEERPRWRVVRRTSTRRRG
jgi:DNA-binding LacI/PurR family transcriptional regulator